MNTATSQDNGTTDLLPPAQDQARSKRTQPTKTLPSDRLAFEKQVSALRAFAVAHGSNGGKPVTNEEAGKIVGMAAATVVVTNAFFCDVGLLQRQKDEQGFIPSADAIAYNKAYEWNRETAREKLRPVFERGWFAEALLPRLKFRPYELNEALTVLAEASSASKEHEPWLQVLLEYLAFSGAVVREGSQIRAGQNGVVEPMPAAAKIEPNEKAALPPVDAGHELYTLILDPKEKRKFVVQAPHTITKRELERIRSWLEFQLIVEDADGSAKPM